MALRSKVFCPILIFIVLVSLASAVHPSAASQPVPQFQATVHSNYVDVSMNIRVFQNLTDIESGFSLPASNGTLTGNDSTSLASAIQASIQNKTLGAQVSGLNLQLASTSLRGGLSQWFNVSLQFRVSGVQTSKAGLQYVNMDWKSFNVPQNVTVGGVEVNNIGTAYLASVATTISNLERSSTRTSIITYSNIVNYFRVTTGNLVSATERINLLNFTQLLPAVETWQETYDPSTNSQTWTFYINQILGLMIQTTSTEPHATPTTDGVIYSIQAIVSAPARSYARGDTIVAVFNDTTETIMLAVIVVGLAVLISSLFIERRISRRVIRRKTKK
jgi:hypothetical protein